MNSLVFRGFDGVFDITGNVPGPIFQCMRSG